MPTDGQKMVIWDSVALRFGLRTQPSDHNASVVKRRCDGSVVTWTLGPLEALTVQDPRHEVRVATVDAESSTAIVAIPTAHTFVLTLLADRAER